MQPNPEIRSKSQIYLILIHLNLHNINPNLITLVQTVINAVVDDTATHLFRFIKIDQLVNDLRDAIQLTGTFANGQFTEQIDVLRKRFAHLGQRHHICCSH